MAPSIEKKVRQATLWSTVTEVAAKLITPLVNMILARLLTPDDFGIVATLTMVTSFADIFTDAGFQKYLIQHEFRSRGELNRYTHVAFWTNLAISSCLFLLIFLFRDTVAAWVGSPELGIPISVASISLLLTSFSSIQMARFKRDFDFKALFFIRIVAALIPLVVTVPLALILRSYWAILIGTLLSNLFNAVALTLCSSWKPRFFYRLSLLKKMFSFSMWTLLESISIWLTSYIGTFIVGQYLSKYYLGLYKTAMSTVNSYMFIITGAITPVLFSALSRYQNNRRKFRQTFFHFQRLTAILVIPMGFGIFLFSDVVTLLLLGSQWMEASGFIGLWGLMSGLTIVFSHYSSEVYRSKGKPLISLISQLLHLAFLVPVIWITVQKDFTTLYVARSLVRFQLILTSMFFIQFFFGIHISDTLRNVLPTIFCAGLMCLVGWGLKQISPSLVWQLCAIVLCVVVYFTALLGLFPSFRRDAKAILKKRR